MTNMKDRRVLITGADSTARVVAETFVANGARVFACDIREEAVKALDDDQTGIRGMVANVGDESGVRELARTVMEEFGGVDFLINVVGIAGPSKPTEEVTTNEWQSTLNANLNGVFYTSREVIPGMKERGYGGIINFSSASTKTRLPNRSPYITSKFAIEGLTLNLARELGPFGVRANAVLPGGIDNERVRTILQRLADERGTTMEFEKERSLQYSSMRTLIQPQELADTVVFLCSDEARHITGQLIAVDGNQEWED